MRKVLEEEEYLRVLEGILRRDYYPELPPLLYEAEAKYTLEGFQAEYTTEDDASFSSVMRKLNKERSRLYSSRYHQRQNLPQPQQSTPQPIQSAQHPTLTNCTDQSVRIKPENTRTSVGHTDAHAFRKAEKVYNFIPMTPTSTTVSNTSTGSLSPAARNLLRSVRKRHLHASPFGGATPQRKNNKKPLQE